MTIRIVLHSRDEKLYISGNLEWWPTSEKAREFPNAQAAVDFSREHGLKGMEIMVTRDKDSTLCIPLREFPSR
jgi:hypothetical protein